MTPNEFFSAYLDEIWKTHYSILKGVPTNPERVQEIYQENLRGVIDRLFPQDNFPEEVTVLYDASYNLINDWIPSKTTDERKKRFVLHLLSVEKKRKPYLTINDFIARRLDTFVKDFARQVEKHYSGDTVE